MKSSASVSQAEATIQEFKDNPKESAAYLRMVLVDGDQDEVLCALRRIAAAFGGIPDDVPGLATEADTLESLNSKLQTMEPDLLEANVRVQVAKRLAALGTPMPDMPEISRRQTAPQ